MDDLERHQPPACWPRRLLPCAARLGAFYGALFLIFGCQLLYLPIWLDAHGLSAREIAVITGAPFFIRLFVTPLTAAVGDRHALHRDLVVALTLAALLLSVVLSQATAFRSIALVAVPLAVAVSTVMPLTEALAVAAVRTSGADYGRMRLWGSLTFMSMGLLGGALIDRFGSGLIIWLLVAGAGATAVAAHLLPFEPRDSKSTAMSEGGLGMEGTRLLASPVFLLFLVSVGAVQGAHGMFYTFGALHWREQGLSALLVGALWSVGIIAEVLVFAFSGSLVRRIAPPALITMACGAAVVRWGLMAADPAVWLLFPLQALHGLTYGASHLGAIHFISRAVPDSAGGTAQALYLTVAAGLVMGGATLISGPLYAEFGGKAYLAMAALCSAGFVSGIILAQRWDGGALRGLHRAPISPRAPAAAAE